MPFLRKYNTLLVAGTTAIRVPMIKRGVVDFAIGADWTPAAGDVKILLDNAAAANVTNLPTAVATANTGAMWEFVLTAAELSGKQCEVVISDAATKAIEDQSFIVEMYGNASAMYAADLSLANLPANLVQILGTTLTETAGQIAAAFKKVFDVASATFTALSVNQTGDSYARIGAPASASLALDIAAIRLDTNTTVPNLIAALNNLSAAGAKAQMVAALATDTYAEPAQGAPSATATLAVKINMIYKFMINLKKQTATDLKVYNAAASVVDHKITSIADDGTTLTEPGVISGP